MLYQILDVGVQFCAAAMLLYGLYQMGNYKLRGPFFAAVSEVIWVGVGVVHGVWGLIFLSVVLTVMQARNFLAWRHNRHSW